MTNLNLWCRPRHDLLPGFHLRQHRRSPRFAPSHQPPRLLRCLKWLSQNHPDTPDVKWLVGNRTMHESRTQNLLNDVPDSIRQRHLPQKNLGRSDRKSPKSGTCRTCLGDCWAVEYYRVSAKLNLSPEEGSSDTLAPGQRRLSGRTLRWKCDSWTPRWVQNSSDRVAGVPGPSFGNDCHGQSNDLGAREKPRGPSLCQLGINRRRRASLLPTVAGIRDMDPVVTSPWFTSATMSCNSARKQTRHAMRLAQTDTRGMEREGRCHCVRGITSMTWLSKYNPRHCRRSGISRRYKPPRMKAFSSPCQVLRTKWPWLKAGIDPKAGGSISYHPGGKTGCRSALGGIAVLGQWPPFLEETSYRTVTRIYQLFRTAHEVSVTSVTYRPLSDLVFVTFHDPGWVVLTASLKLSSSWRWQSAQLWREHGHQPPRFWWSRRMSSGHLVELERWGAEWQHGSRGNHVPETGLPGDDERCDSQLWDIRGALASTTACFVTNSKGLYDSLWSLWVLGWTRTIEEVVSRRCACDTSKSTVRWVHSAAMPADGFTKSSSCAPRVFMVFLDRGYWCLVLPSSRQWNVW